MKRSTVEERKAYCKQHGHSWIKPYPKSESRRCSYCGTYEAEVYNKQMDARNTAIREGIEKPWLPLHDGE